MYKKGMSIIMEGVKTWPLNPEKDSKYSRWGRSQHLQVSFILVTLGCRLLLKSARVFLKEELRWCNSFEGRCEGVPLTLYPVPLVIMAAIILAASIWGRDKDRIFRSTESCHDGLFSF